MKYDNTMVNIAIFLVWMVVSMKVCHIYELVTETEESEYQYKVMGNINLIGKNMFQIILNTIIEPYCFFYIYWTEVGQIFYEI